MSRTVCSFAGHSEIFDYDEAKGRVRKVAKNAVDADA